MTICVHGVPICLDCAAEDYASDEVLTLKARLALAERVVKAFDLLRVHHLTMKCILGPTACSFYKEACAALAAWREGMP